MHGRRVGVQAAAAEQPVARARVDRRDALIGAFAAATNILDRRNVLTVIVDPVTGRRTAIDMRPLAPLVAGIDWRY